MIYQNVDDFVTIFGRIKEAAANVDPHTCRLVATSGAFDILHSGHVKLLKLCRNLGDITVVLLNTDASIKSYKSEHRPIKDWQTRAEILDAMECVSHVIGLPEPTPVDALDKLRPNIWVKGDRPIQEIVEKDVLFNADCDIIVLWNSQAGSSTDLIEKAAKAWEAEQIREDD